MQNCYPSNPVSSFNGNTNTGNKVDMGDSQNANKICQWYCCSCGQSYGSIIYKDNRETEIAEEKEDDIFIKKLKYYSQILYSGGDPSYSKYEYLNSSKNLRTPEERVNVNYFEPVRRRSSSMTDLNENFKRLGDTEPVPHAISTFPSSCTSPSVSPVPGLFEYNSKVAVCIPTRFNCHRCNHMMCPYCLKIRLRDLDN